MDRRRFLRASALATLGGLAGCTGGGDSAGDGTGTPSPTTTTGTGATATTSPTATTTSSTTTSSTTTATPTTTATTGATTGTTATTQGPSAAVEVAVGPGGNLRFDPESFVLEAGGTVTWVWKSGGHNVVPSAQPDGADWSGTPGGPGETHGTGYEYEYTFDVAGDYGYYCSPHRGFGMTGSFTVVEP